MSESGKFWRACFFSMEKRARGRTRRGFASRGAEWLELALNQSVEVGLYHLVRGACESFKILLEKGSDFVQKTQQYLSPLAMLSIFIGVHHSNTQTRTREVPNSHGHGYHFLSHFLFSPLHHLRHILLLANNPARNEFPSRWPH